jgi:alanine dehydrogenase
MVIGGGVVGQNAAEIAIGMGAETYVYDRSIDRLRELEVLLNGRCSTCFASTLEIEERLPEMDLVIGAVLIHGAKAPRVIRRDQLRLMKRNAVLVDVSIDQGGCFETSHATTHSDPTYEVDGITHYCVANMPGAVPITSTWALTNATMPYVLKLADRGVRDALASDDGFLKGLNVAAGRVTYAPVAEDQGLEYTPPAEALALAPALA